MKRNNMNLLRFNMAIESGKVKIFNPTQAFLEKVKSCATSVGDSFYLSDTDVQVLATALEINIDGKSTQIVTDDYSIQNVSAMLGISFVSLTTLGIKRLLKWIRYCPACYRTYPSNYRDSDCPVCGTKLKRKTQRNQPNVSSSYHNQ